MTLDHGVLGHRLIVGRGDDFIVGAWAYCRAIVYCGTIVLLWGHGLIIRSCFIMGP